LEALAVLHLDGQPQLLLKLDDPLLGGMEELCELVPALLKLVVLLSDLELGLVCVVDDAHGGGKLAVELLLTRL